ncbi:MAG: binary toxin-like calcium binding domain-containing protein [Verrucomicrobiota bacterium]
MQVSPATTGFVDVVGTGSVFVLDGDGLGGGQWLDTASTFNLSGGQATAWMRLSYRLDYLSKTWDLFVDGTFVAYDIGFLDNSANFLEKFSLESDPNYGTGLDFFYAGSTNPLYADTSNDGLPDTWLQLQGLDTLINQRYLDPDFDGLNNLQEYQLTTGATNPDTDGDGFSDSAELAAETDPTVADLFVFNDLPLFEGFESWTAGPLSTTDAWTIVGDSVSIATGSSFDGNQNLMVSGTSEVFSFLKGSGNSVVWVDQWLKPTPGDMEDVIDADVSSAFSFDDSQRLRVYDPSFPVGQRWLTADVIASGSWRRITLKSDYLNQLTDYYVDGTRVFSDIPFIRTKPFLTQMEIYGDTGLDNLTVSTVQPLGLDDDRDGLSNEEEGVRGTNPLLFDTDGDGVGDLTEIQWGMDPIVPDVLIASLSPQGNGVFSWFAEFSPSEGYLPGPLNGQLGWLSTGTAEVQGDESLAIIDNGVEISSATQRFGIENQRRVWVSFDADLLEGDLPETIATLHAFVIGKKDETSISIWDAKAGEWIDIFPSSLVPGVNQYAFYLDYITKTTSVFLNGVMYAQDIPFVNADLVYFSHLDILQNSASSSSAQFDNFIVSNGEPEGMDFDGDGLLNETERLVGSNLYAFDTDSDGMSDLWEYNNGLNLLVDDSEDDLDADGLANIEEFDIYTDPNLIDTDGDGFTDTEELFARTSPIDSSEAPDGLLPDPWQTVDYGNVDSGYGFVFGDSWLLSSAGNGVEDSSFFYRENTGGYSMTFRVDNVESGNNKTQVGLMVRNSIDVDSKMVAGYLRITDRFYQSTRASDSDKLTINGPTYYGDFLPGLYLRVTRGEILTVVEASGDGILWSVIAETATQFDLNTVAGIYLSSGRGDREFVAANVELVGYTRDTDFDGLSDLDEVTIYSTNPLNADTDSDGVSDGEEVLVRGSDPLVSEYASTSTVLTISGSEASTLSGSWVMSGDSIYSSSLNGELSFDFNITTPGIYEIHYKVARRIETQLTLGMPVFFVAKINGQYLENVQIADAEFSQDQVLLTPYLDVGSHTFNLRWDNVFRGRSVQIDYVKVESPDFATEVLRDEWELAILSAQEGAFESNIMTHVSPVSLEGFSRFPGMMAISNGAFLRRSETNQWYTRIEVSEPNTSFVVDYQNGGLSQIIDVSWEPMVLFADDSPEEFIVTTGSQLKFILSELAGVNGHVNIGSSVYGNLSGSEETVHKFSESGQYTIIADVTYPGGVTDSRQIVVDVVEIPDTSHVPNVWLEQQREWTWENISPLLPISRGQALAKVKSIGENSIHFELGSNLEFPGNTLTARLPDGSPITSVEMNTFWLVEAVEGYLKQFKRQDGTSLVQSTLYISPDFSSEDILIRIDIFKAGVTFDDGTRVREVSLSEFAVDGTYDFVLIKPDSVRGSVCHRTYVYQDGVLIGKIGRR